MRRISLLLVIALLSSLVCKGQNSITELRSMTGSKPDWKKIDKAANLAERHSAMSFLYEESSFCMSKSEGSYSFNDFISHHSASVHLLDVDGDNDRDLIFDGFEWPGHSSGIVNIYMNNGGYYSEQLSVPGRVVKIDQSSKQAVISIYNYPCCATTLNKITHYSFSPSESKLIPLRSVIFITCSGKISDDALPGTDQELKALTCGSDSVLLRWSPHETDRCHGNDGNVYAALAPGTACNVWSLSEDKKWAFVAVNNYKGVTFRDLSIFSKERHVTALGWVESSKIK